MNDKSYYFSRLLARLTDILFVGLMGLILEKIIPHFELDIFPLFIAYNFTVILLYGRTLGKNTFCLSTRSDAAGLKQLGSLLIRDLLIFVLFPILLINFIGMSAIPLHDRICGTKVVKDAR